MPEVAPFTSTNIRTSNVAKELLKIAKTHSISVHDLDFVIKSTELYIREITKETPDADFAEATDNQLAKLKDPQAKINPDLSLKQVYDIEIIPLIKEVFPNLKVGMASNKSLTSVYATIKAGSVIESTDDIANDLRDYFNKRKLRTQIIIDLWDEEMVSELARMAAKIEINGSLSFDEDQRIMVSKSILAKPVVNDKLTIHFDDKPAEDSEWAKVDYKKRGFITAVEIDELLISYSKPQEGAPGRNCKGEFVDVPPPDASHAPKFEIDSESIQVKEDEKKIEYFAKKNGYIDVDGTKYFIKESLEVSEISFKSTGNVSAGLNADISIHVKESDPLGDAIGMGVEVEATEVDVEGNVGSNSKVKAQKIRIGGQTHKSAELRADNVEVNLHRGLIIGKEVKVKRLEQGRIEGETVNVEQAAGGEIVAKNVVIEILQSHMYIVASESITIKKMVGSENVLEIDQTQVGKNVDAVDTLEDDLTVKRQEINVARKELEAEKEIFDKHRGTMLDIKKRLISYKKAGAKLPTAFVQKFKEFQTLELKIGTQEKDIRLMQDTYEMMEKRRGRFQRSVLDAQVINEGEWKGHNEVKFHLTSPEQDLVYIPKEGVKHSAIMLKYDEEKDEYTVVSESADIPEL